jgi:hypothetical protein
MFIMHHSVADVVFYSVYAIVGGLGTASGVSNGAGVGVNNRIGSVIVLDVGNVTDVVNNHVCTLTHRC